MLTLNRCKFLVLPFVFLTLPISYVSANVFSISDITTPLQITQPVQALNLIDNENEDMDEFIVIGVDENNNNSFAIYSYDASSASFTLFHQQVIPKKYFAYDFSPKGDGKNKKLSTVYFLAKDEVAYYQPVIESNVTNASCNQSHVQSDNQLDNQPDSQLDHQQQVNNNHLKTKKMVSSMYLIDSANYLTRQHFIEDFNEDGFDDIVLFGFEAVKLWLSQPCSDLHVNSLPISTFVELNGSQINYNKQTLFYVDLNLDGIKDIAWIKQGEIEYFTQSATGSFAKSPSSIPINPTIFGLNWWDIREADGDNLDQSKLSHRLVEKLQDVNGDGLVDMVVRFTNSSGVLDRTNDYEFYFGKKLVDGQSSQVTYFTKAETVIKADGTLTGLNIIDIDNDGKQEVMLSSFELSLTNIIGALVSGSIDQEVLIFSLDNANHYGEKPSINKTVELSFSLTKGRSGQPIVKLADVNGDRIDDLVLSDDDDELHIYYGNNTKKRFNKKAVKQDLFLPKNGEIVGHFDINHDGKEDFIFSYGRLDEDKSKNIFTVLLTN